MMNCALLARVPWNEPIPLEEVMVEIPPRLLGQAFFSIPNDLKRFPVRPYLQPFAGYGGVVGIIRQEGKPSLPGLVLLEGEGFKYVELAAPPRAAMRREDGKVWVLHRQGLVLYDEQGQTLERWEVTGQTLVGSCENTVWVVDDEQAYWVTAEGKISEPREWQKGWIPAIGPEGSLSVLTRFEKPTLACLRPNGRGVERVFPFSYSFIDKLVLYQDNLIITESGLEVCFFDLTSARSQRYGLVNMGLSDTQAVFACLYEFPEFKLWLGQKEQKLPSIPAIVSPEGRSHYMEAVEAVVGNRCLLYTAGYAAWYHQDEPLNPFQVDEAGFEREIFPYSWRIGGMAATPDGKVILSTSGPTGIALLSLEPDWDSNPRYVLN